MHDFQAMLFLDGPLTTHWQYLLLLATKQSYSSSALMQGTLATATSTVDRLCVEGSTVVTAANHPESLMPHIRPLGAFGVLVPTMLCVLPSSVYALASSRASCSVAVFLQLGWDSLVFGSSTCFHLPLYACNSGFCWGLVFPGLPAFMLQL